MKKCFFIFILTASAFLIYAQHHSQYFPEAGNEIKALTSEQINGYLTGEGMGLAKAAELNHYPGPKHVLELASELNLSQSQIDSTNKIYDSMKEEAIQFGKTIVEKEKILNQLFSDENANKESVQNLVNEIALSQGKLRSVHLNAHIKQKEILTSEQIAVYDKLRVYSR